MILMRALLYCDWEKLELAEMPMPSPGEGEVLIRAEAAGICGSELDAVRKRSPRRQPPLVLGHEFTGVVESVGAGVNAWKQGDAVVANAVIGDGICSFCLQGKPHLCPERQLFGMHRQGAFAEYVVAPVSTLVRRPAGLPPEQAALAEPLANGIHVANLYGKPCSSAIVLGAGPIGLFVMQALKLLLGCDVAMYDRSEARLRLALRLGANAIFQPGQEDGLRRFGGEWGAALCVDAVGAETTKALSLACLQPGGTAIWIGLAESAGNLNSYDLILPEKSLLGSYACTQDELELALDWMATGKVDASSWVSTYSLYQGVQAFQTMMNPGPDDVKAVIRIQ